LATETKEVEATQSPVKAAEATNSLPTFRWPARGRVIASYGAKTNGKQNDGINIAVPEGTPVKAADDGVVAYAGNELKGYGNLVLVRHSNGYVTAYAHASELMVKRGDTIKRGQVIAKSGQTGEVSSPQLHFEIRNGSSPVDPLQFLNGA
jgi:murein DD-endopeptidase MepM/ murein hydrolase activator NlpD